MATINFLYRSAREKAPLTLRLLYRSNNKDYVIGAKTNYFIEKYYWENYHFKNKKDAIIRNKQIDVSSDLQKIENFVLDKFNETDISRINKKWLDGQLKLYYDPPLEKKINEEVSYWFKRIEKEAHLRNNGKGGVGLSKSRIDSLNNLLELFNNFQGKKNYKVKELNKKIFEDFKKWLLDKQNYSHTYAFKKLADLKGVCKEARANGIETSIELTDIKTKQLSAYEDDMDVIYLTLEEIGKIEKATLLNEAHINARKWLILACFTGQRGNDLIKMTPSSFVKTKNKEAIEIIQQKTGKKVEIPILPKVREIYNNGFPYKVSTQRLNEYFKKIGEIAEINTPVMGRIIEASENKEEKKKRGVKKIRPKYKYISTHIGRRSFASNHYTKLPTPIIMKVTGHTKENTFLTYINKSDSSHIEAFLEYYKIQEQEENKEA